MVFSILKKIINIEESPLLQINYLLVSKNTSPLKKDKS